MMVGWGRDRTRDAFQQGTADANSRYPITAERQQICCTLLILYPSSTSILFIINMIFFYDNFLKNSIISKDTYLLIQSMCDPI